MNEIIGLLRENARVSDYKINIHKKESFELFYSAGKLETGRCTEVCDKEVTCYVDHDGFRGEAQFFLYPSTTREQMIQRIEEAVEKAMLIRNQPYCLPEKETGDYQVDSNFSEYEPDRLALKIADLVFQAGELENGSLNSVEIFINRHTRTVLNSRGLHKTQVSYDAMVEAIPTYTQDGTSVELYEQYNFSTLNPDALKNQISGKMKEVKARFEAAKPDFSIDCPVVIHKQELSELFREIAYDLNYASVYSHSNLFSRGDAIQSNPAGDLIGITMAGSIPGSIRSSAFDGDGISLYEIRIVDDGKAVNYFGSNRFGQYLNETPTGNLPCIRLDAGSAVPGEIADAPYLEILSMSGLQVDFYTDYIGGEIRLACYHDNGKTIPLTGISISGKLSEVLNYIRLSSDTVVYNGYQGPDFGILSHISVF